MTAYSSYKLFPLGDSAVTIDFGNIIDESVNKKVVALFRHLQANPFEGMIEAVPAYSSLSIYYDIIFLKKRIKENTVYDRVKEKLEKILTESFITENNADSRLVRIPVCYEKEMAPDLETLAFTKNLSTDDVIRLHTSKTYHVYMLGFLPGFPYLGEVDTAIEMSRKLQPVPVLAGSIGIAGKQTGIYPFDSPGGWQIIGRTPLKLFDPNNGNNTLLNAGDTVQFYAITKDEFKNY